MSEQTQRYDLITNYRCGSAIEEMERADDGDWVRYEDVQGSLAAAEARVTALAQREAEQAQIIGWYRELSPPHTQATVDYQIRITHGAALASPSTPTLGCPFPSSPTPNGHTWTTTEPGQTPGPATRCDCGALPWTPSTPSPDA